MRRLVFAISLVFLFSFAFTCKKQGGLSAKDMTAIKALEAAVNENALKRDYIALAELFTKDVVQIFPSGMTMQGRDQFIPDPRMGPGNITNPDRLN